MKNKKSKFLYYILLILFGIALIVGVEVDKLSLKIILYLTASICLISFSNIFYKNKKYFNRKQDMN